MSTGSSSKKIAVVGSGISGLSAAWLLASGHEVTLYEASRRLGGHTHTVEAQVGDVLTPVDLGFIVYNEVTYPNLTALFAHLGVLTRATDMSFGVSLDDGAIEYGGVGLAPLLGRPRNLFSPRFWSMLSDLWRFYRSAPADLPKLDDDLTLGAYLTLQGYGFAFQEDHLLPQAAAIWSAPVDCIREFPAVAFIRFFENHGLLKLAGRPIWRTVTGGSSSYVAPLLAPIADRVRNGATVRSIRREGDGVWVTDSQGISERYDDVVIATHADEALAMLARPTLRERTTLGAFRYTANTAVLHTDVRLMPRRRAVWSSWNYLGARPSDGRRDVCVTYWMNRLQGLKTPRPLLVTVNPITPPDPSQVLRREEFSHPLFDGPAIGAQRQLWDLQGAGGVWFCGAHFGAGFHEDGLQAGLAVAEAIGGVRRPWKVASESGRILSTPVPVETAIAA